MAKKKSRKASNKHILDKHFDLPTSAALITIGAVLFLAAIIILTK